MMFSPQWRNDFKTHTHTTNECTTTDAEACADAMCPIDKWLIPAKPTVKYGACCCSACKSRAAITIFFNSAVNILVVYKWICGEFNQ
jgi:hypothetical protein